MTGNHKPGPSLEKVGSVREREKEGIRDKGQGAACTAQTRPEGAGGLPYPGLPSLRYGVCRSRPAGRHFAIPKYDDDDPVFDAVIGSSYLGRESLMVHRRSALPDKQIDT